MPTGKDRAKELFQRLGEAEAAIHGMPLDRVHLHEVGALDSIIDIVGTVFALESLGADRIVASPLNVGGGTVRLGARRVSGAGAGDARLLQGAPIYSGQQQVELVTPTGALLVTGYAQEFGAAAGDAASTRIGYGAGIARSAGHAERAARRGR